MNRIREAIVVCIVSAALFFLMQAAYKWEVQAAEVMAKKQGERVVPTRKTDRLDALEARLGTLEAMLGVWKWDKGRHKAIDPVGPQQHWEIGVASRLAYLERMNDSLRVMLERAHVVRRCETIMIPDDSPNFWDGEKMIHIGSTFRVEEKIHWEVSFEPEGLWEEPK